MPTPTVWPSAKQVLGISNETTQGTANTTLGMTAPVLAFEPEDKYTWLKDEALRGSMVKTYGVIQGPQMVDFSGNGPVFFDWLPYLVKNILGGLDTTGAGPYTHVGTVLNSGTGQPGSLTFTDWQGPTATTQARTYSGCCLSELTLKGNPESTLLEWSMKGSGWASAAYPTSPPVFSPSTDSPVAAWRCSLQLAGAPNLTTREWEVTITRELKLVYTNQNAQTPFVIARGPVTVTGSLQFAAPSDETALNYLRNNTQPALNLVIDNGLATTSQRRLTLDLALTAFDTVKIDRQDVPVGYASTFESVAATSLAGASSGYSPIKATIINNTVGATY